MEDQVVDFSYNFDLEKFVSDKNISQRWSWKFGESATLPTLDIVLISKLQLFWNSSLAI